MLLSIIIPCYNSSRFIAHTLDMLIKQSLQDCEVIVVNDGSTDDTTDIVHGYTQKNAAIQLIDKQNEGVSVARNTGMGVAKGDYISFLDSDDTLTDGTLDFYRKILAENHEKKFFGFGYYTQENGNLHKDYSARKFDGKTLDSLLLKQSFFAKKLCFHICSCIYEREFLQENKIKFTPGLRIGEDLEFLLKVLQFAPNCIYNARHCFVYQIRDDSTMQGYRNYSIGYFNSFLILKTGTEENCTHEIEKECNYFIAFSYISNLYHYLKSDYKNALISSELQNYKSVLKKKMPFFSIKMSILIFLLRLIPLKLLLVILKK